MTLSKNKTGTVFGQSRASLLFIASNFATSKICLVCLEFTSFEAFKYPSRTKHNFAFFAYILAVEILTRFLVWIH